jgi:hypothetical protein
MSFLANDIVDEIIDELKIWKNGENENPRNGFAWNSEERKSEREEELLLLRWFGEGVGVMVFI